MKKLVSAFAIALFLSIPLAANADPVGTANISISASGDYGVYIGAERVYVLYQGHITQASFSYIYNNTTVDLFCISPQNASNGPFEFNTITNAGSYYGYGDLVNPVLISSTAVSEAAYVADNYQTLLGSSQYDRAMAQIAIWGILGMLNIASYQGTFPEAYNLYNAAQGHGDYATNNWYAAFDSQDYLAPNRVPEPGILILLGIAMSAIGAASWRLRKL